MGLKGNDPEIRHWTVYKITNPMGRVYIGISSNFKQRLRLYKNQYRQTQPLVIRSLIKYGFEAHTIEVLETFTSDSNVALSKEMFWIRTYMSNKSRYPEMNGMNLTDGGQGTIGIKITEEQKKLLSRINKGNKHTEETKKKIGEASKRNNKGRIVSEATKEKIRLANIGKKYSEETKKKLSEMRQGKKIKSGWTTEKRQKMSETKKGQYHTQETKNKISQTLKKQRSKNVNA